MNDNSAKILRKILKNLKSIGENVKCGHANGKDVFQSGTLNLANKVKLFYLVGKFTLPEIS